MDATTKASLIEKRSKLTNVLENSKSTVEYFDALLKDMEVELAKLAQGSLEVEHLKKRFEDLKQKRWENWSTMECARIELAMEVNQLPLIDLPGDGQAVLKGKIIGKAG